MHQATYSSLLVSQLSIVETKVCGSSYSARVHMGHFLAVNPEWAIASKKTKLFIIDVVCMAINVYAIFLLYIHNHSCTASDIAKREAMWTKTQWSEHLEICFLYTIM